MNEEKFEVNCILELLDRRVTSFVGEINERLFVFLSSFSIDLTQLFFPLGLTTLSSLD